MSFTLSHCEIIVNIQILEIYNYYMNNLKNLRLTNKLTQVELAKKLNIRQNTYSQYETRCREIPIDTLIKLAYLYDTSIDYILGITYEETPYPRI